MRRQRLKALFSNRNRKFSGVNRKTSTLSRPEQSMAYFSGASLATLFGITSPKIRITMVVKTVASASPDGPKAAVETAAARDAVAMFTTLFPIRMVDRASSKWFSSRRAFRAFLLPPLAWFFSRSLLEPVRAVSEAEKKAEKEIKTIRISVSAVVGICKESMRLHFLRMLLIL